MATLSKSGGSSSSNKDVISNLQLQQKYNTEAYEYISCGLGLIHYYKRLDHDIYTHRKTDLDQVSPQDALTYYKKGIEVLRKAIRIQFTPSEW